MSKIKQVLFFLLTAFLLCCSVYAMTDDLSIRFPDYYEEISENHWYTDTFTINDKPTTIEAEITFHNAKYTKEKAFSDDNLSAIMSSVSSGALFKEYINKPEITTAGDKEYKCIYLSYVDTNNCGIMEYTFYSPEKFCKVTFKSENPVYVTTRAENIISTISFKESFYSDIEPTATDEDNTKISNDDNITEEKNDRKDTLSIVIFIVLIPLLFAFVIFIIVQYIYKSFDHGKWSKNSVPNISAVITDISSKKDYVGKNDIRFKTTVTFSDGYIFVTRKTNRKDNLFTYNISINEELRANIIRAATNSHSKAVRKITGK